MNTWTIPSNTKPGTSYEVTCTDEGEWSCDCPFVPKQNRRYCSHILTAQSEIVAGKVKGPAEGLDESWGVFTNPGDAMKDLVERSKEKIDALTRDGGPRPDDAPATAEAEHVAVPVSRGNGSPEEPAPEGPRSVRSVGPVQGSPSEDPHDLQTPEQRKAEAEAAEIALQAAQEAALAVNPVIEVTNIETAIVAVMEAVAYVQKAGRVTGTGPQYNFAGEADLIRALRPHLVRNGITMAVTKVKSVKVREYETRGGSAMTNTQLLMRVTFTHAVTGTKKHVWSAGEGSDSGDKSTPKALTGAYKYALRETFIIETGDDPDQQSSSEQQRAPQGERRERAERTQQGAARNDSAVPGWWNWFINERKDKGLQAADLVPILGGPCAPLRVTTWLDALEPKPLTAEEISAGLQKLLSRAVDWKSKRQEG